MRHSALLAAVLAGACTYSDPVDASDSGVFFPTVRIRFDPGEPPAEADVAEGDRETTAAIELAGTGARGDLDVDTPAGASGRYELVEVTAMGRTGLVGDRWDAAVLFGLAIDHLELDFVRSFGPVSDTDTFIGFALGGELGVEPIERVRPYVRASASMLAPFASVLQGEVGVDWNAVGALRVAAGYRVWRLEAEGWNFSQGATDLELTLRGVFVALEARF